MRAARGATLLEVLLSLTLVMVGLAALFATLSTATVGSSMSSRLSQAQLRAQMLVESIRLAPKPALDCLASTAATSWSACENGGSTGCLQNQSNDGGTQKIDACIFTLSSLSNVSGPKAGPSLIQNQTVDRSGQPYQLVYDTTTPTSSKSSFVRKNANSVYDIQVTVGWNDDGTAGAAGVVPTHTLTLETGVYAP